MRTILTQLSFGPLFEGSYLISMPRQSRQTNTRRVRRCGPLLAELRLTDFIEFCNAARSAIVTLNSLLDCDGNHNAEQLVFIRIDQAPLDIDVEGRVVRLNLEALRIRHFGAGVDGARESGVLAGVVVVERVRKRNATDDSVGFHHDMVASFLVGFETIEVFAVKIFATRRHEGSRGLIHICSSNEFDGNLPSRN